MFQQPDFSVVKAQTLAYLCFIVAVLVMVHQYVVWGTWWSWDEFLHHENFAFGLVCIGFGILLGKRLRR